MQLLSEQLTNKLERYQRQKLERANRHRLRFLSLDVKQPLYTTNNIKNQKDHNPFIKLNDPKPKSDNKIIDKNKVIHVIQVKPQRNIISGQQNDETDSDVDNIPLSMLINKDREHQQPHPAYTIG